MLRISAPAIRAISQSANVMIDARLFSQKALSGVIPPRSSGKYSLSQCLSFQRLKASLNQFMPGLRGRSVWKQNDSTECPGATLRPG
ncbi:hypothetical protein DY943_29585 [Pseudomonas aeruginosa]|nr:hypothetical protein P797_09085 [Pseudomonas aeruginosa VRFPA04]AVR85046.1 hypothetical protein C8257_25030 [Pseudomonas aeruginosa]RMJ37402.1 hypothetical protein BFC97_22720 [Pseudomonas aeruginosa 39016]AXN27179.1 hypothetical protein CP913_20700 [Pseudomonas aeruginosa]AXS87104.1 hypothetical protein D0Y56_09100 [Pseudomonas aeruginosa]